MEAYPSPNSKKYSDSEYGDEGVIDGSRADLIEVTEEMQAEQLHKFIGALLSENKNYPG
jgi:hypothetical protein